MKYYIIAGEASGDLHASNLIKALQSIDNSASFRCWGGDLMEESGGEIIKHYRDLAFMGFIEVVANLPTILSNIAFCKKDIQQYQPDVIVFVDYPGFNLRIAEWAKKNGFRTHFYISPQLWAWKEGRVKKVKAYIDKMYVILPFEEAFYQKHQYKAHFVGHPLLDEIETFQKDPQFLNDHQLSDSKKIIALLPGSRKQEIKKMLSMMMEIAQSFPQYQFVIAGAPSQELSFYQSVITHPAINIPIIENKTYQLLAHSHAALVTSGTATLETALFKVPEVVLYKGSNISYQIAKRIISIKYISLVNLIMDAPIVKELIQDDCSSEKISKELNNILEDQGRLAMLENYQLLSEKLGGVGASKKVAKIIYETISA